MAKPQIVAGLELAATKLRMVVMENGAFLTASEVDCLDGLKNGAIINLDNVTEAVIRLLENVNQKLGKKINSILINISGADIKQEIANSIATFPQRGHEITKRNVDELIESCKLMSIPLDRGLLYLLPLEYLVDGQDGIKEPVGLYGNRLEARIFIITAPLNQIQNITKAVNAAGVEVEEFVLTPLANANSILNIEEKKEGVLLVDFKTELTEASIFKEGLLVFFETISKGQGALTNEIAARFNIPLELAEELKRKYGFLDTAEQDKRNQESLPLEWMGSRQEVPRGELNKVISDQCGLLFDLILERVKGRLKNFNNIIKRGAVLSGGCTSLEGFLEGAAQRFGFNTRTGILKQDIGPLENRYIVSSGLVRFGLEKRQRARQEGDPGFFKKVYQKAGEVLTEYF